MDKNLFKAWQRGGEKTKSLRAPFFQRNNSRSSRKRLLEREGKSQLIKGNNAALGNLVLKPKESGF